MSRYIKSFENDAAIQSAVDNGVLSKPYVAYDESANTIDWNSKTIDYSKMPLTFEIISGGELYWKRNSGGDSNNKTIKCSINGGNYFEVTSSGSGNGTLIGYLNAGDIVKIVGNNNSYSYSYYNCFNNQGSNIRYNIYGNFMSLFSENDYQNIKSFSEKYCAKQMWRSSNVVDASNLVLPATGLTDGCYQDMFNNSQFLTKAPELPATTLASYCYNNIFAACSNLNYIKCLATDISANNCTQNWVSGVQTTSGTFVKNPAMSSWSTGTSGIPTNWTVIDA